MNSTKCPVTDKAHKKLVSQLQDILVMLHAEDRVGRLDFLRFRTKTVKQYGLKTFHQVLQEANEGLNVKGLYNGGADTVQQPLVSENRTSVLS